MFRPAHFHRSAELLSDILAGTAPADKRIDAYFRAHREMGSRDRGYVAETVYGCLRRKRTLEVVCPTHPTGADLVAAYLVITQGFSARALSELRYAGDALALVTHARTLDTAQLPLAVRADVPDALADRLRAQLSETETLRLCAALNQPAPVDLRVNTLKATREAVRAQLADAGFATELTPYSPVGLRRQERQPLFKTDAFKNGLFEIQDEGSQLLSFLVDARPHEKVVDFCAGGGGKTLHLGVMMSNTGSLYAFDTSAKRLDHIKPRLRRAGLDNVRSHALTTENDTRVKRLRGTIDRVLVDAPCSGTGTLRRNPDVKWRSIDLPALTSQQKSILRAASALVKPGGRVVYATCSVLREENEEVVENFLAAHPEFKRVPVNDVLAHAHIPLVLPGDDLRLFPHKHGTDGFYGAVLQRA